MTRNGLLSNAIPHWFLRSVRVLQDTDRALRNIEIELQHSIGLDDLDPRLRNEMQYVLDALSAVKISLSVMDVTAKQVLSELAKPESPDHRQAAAG
jgi:hypothetical protein